MSVPLSRRHIISIFKSAALYKGKIMAQEILMLVGQARLEPSSSLTDTAVVVHGCPEVFHRRFVTYIVRLF